MNCLHFKVDRKTRICPDCGVTLPGSGLDASAIPAPMPQAPEPPPPQEIAVRVAAPPAPVIELPADVDDIHELIRIAKGKKAAPLPAHVQSEPTVLAAGYEALKAERDQAVAKATPDWIKDHPQKEIFKSVEDLFGPISGYNIVTNTYTPEPAKQVNPRWQDLVMDDPAEPKGYVPGPEDPIAEPGSIAYSNLDVGIIEDPEDGDEAEDPDTLPYPDEPIFSFLGGTAGTGKSYTAAERARNYNDAILAATTGIAAVNLGGRTINSILQYGNTDQLRVNYETGKLKAILSRLLHSGYYRLLVDEVSMMDGHQLDILVTAIEEINEFQLDKGKRPLGMTLIGDFAQLPPVNAPFVFQRAMWGRFEPNVTLLTEPRRQADPEFVRALQAVRRGDRGAALAYFGRMITSGSQDKFDGSTIFATNIEVDRHNKLRMLELSAPPEYFKAVRIGEQESEWQKQIPDQLEVKPGCLVMILANKTDQGEMVYANGDLAHYVKKINENVAEVTLKRTGMSVFVGVTMKEKKSPTGHTGETKDASGATLPRNAVTGSVTYMPLRVAYATTCHKSQGLSLDNVQIAFHSRFWATPGMMYVALSRARTPQGLRLVGSPAQFEARITVNPDIRRWL